MTNRRHRPSRNLQRRIRAHQLKTGKPYMVAALAVTTEQALGWRHLCDPAVPPDVAEAVRDGGFIPLEPLRRGEAGHWHWWCRCSRCGEVIIVYPDGHGYQRPRRSPYHLHDTCEAKSTVRLHDQDQGASTREVITSVDDWLRSIDGRL